jgi:flagella basal body P-ring formation protein FlgA
MGQVLEPAPVTAVAELKLLRADAPGKSMHISRDLVALKLREARLDEPVEVSGTTCVVSLSSRTVKGADIKAFAEGYIKQRLDALSATAQVELTTRELPKDMLVPDRTVRLDLLPPDSGRFRGNVILRIAAHQTTEDGEDIQVGQAIMSCLVRVKESQLQARRTIRRGEIITSENAAISLVDATYEQEDAYTSLEEAEGLKARTFIIAGKLIAPSMLERPPLVKRGDIVKLVVRAGLVTVNSSAKVLRDGALGDSIPVEIEESHKQVQGKVLDSGTVVSDSH